MLGGAWSYNLNADEITSPINLYLGIWARFSNLTDAIIPYVGLDMGSFTFGMTYDVNVSSLKICFRKSGGIRNFTHLYQKTRRRKKNHSMSKVLRFFCTHIWIPLYDKPVKQFCIFPCGFHTDSFCDHYLVFFIPHSIVLNIYFFRK